MSDPLAQTRRAWHGVAELVLAGPQVRATDHLRLHVVPGGFAAAYLPALRVELTELVAGGRGIGQVSRIGLDGRTPAELAAAAGVEVGAPEGRYPAGCGVDPQEVLHVDRDAASHLAGCLTRGEEALRRFAGAAQPPLWPEHFDVGVSLDEINYGVSLGDVYVAEPYAYVGPWRRREGSFWNAGFGGAARPLRELADVDAIIAFFAEGRDVAATTPPADPVTQPQRPQ
ncbi:MAG: hypothetical protein ACM30G_17745 [Micromonosporaceae bacterium]